MSDEELHPMKDKGAVIVDLDNTLCDDGHRKSLMEAGEWDNYHSRCYLDEVFSDVQRIIEVFGRDGYGILIVTERTERWRQMTENWLFVKGLSHYIDEVYMRPDGDFTPVPELKLRMITSPEFAGLKLENVALAVEDNEKVIVAFRNAGIVTYQVRA